MYILVIETKDGTTTYRGTDLVSLLDLIQSVDKVTTVLGVSISVTSD